MTTDSDMEMEDDITLSCGDQEDNDTTDPLKHKSDVIHGELDVKELIHEAQSSPGWTVPQGVSCEKVSSSFSSELCKKSEGANAVPEQCQLIIVNTPLGGDIDSAGGSEHSLPSERDKSSIPISDVQNTLNDSAAAEVMKSDVISNQNMTVNTPLRLLQDYATENMPEIDHDAFFEDVNAVVVSSSVTTSAKSSQKDAGSHLEIVSQSLGMIDKMSGLLYESRRSKVSSNTKDEVTNTTAIIKNHDASRGKDASTAAPIDIVSKRDKTQEGKKTKSNSALPKVDEYGRLVREGSSDNNSDDPRYNKRHRRRGRSRSRSRSRSHSHSHSRSRSRIRSRSRSRIRSRSRSRSCSRSPPDSRRRRTSPRKSPRRRREKKNGSPSWSSRNHRSRSRSPTFRRAGEFRDENKRQDRRQIPECFDFRRGKCSRGASCRYMCREHDRNDSSWPHKSNQKHLEFQPSLNNSRVKGEIEDRSDMNLDNEIKDVATKDDQFIGADKTACESSKVEAATVQPEYVIQVKLEEIIPHNHDRREFKEVPEQFSSQVMGPKESPLPSLVAASSPYPSQLPLPPPPPPPSLSQGTSVRHVPQLHTDYNQYPVQFIPTGVSHSYQGPLYNQHAQFSVSQDSSWTSLPPPPPRPSFDPSLNAGSAVQGASSQFQQNLLAPRSDFGSQSSARPYGSYTHSKSEFLPQMYPTLAKLPHPPRNRENFGSGNPSNQPGGTGLLRHDHFTHNPLQNVSSSQSFAHGYTRPQAAPQNFSGDNFPVHPHTQNQQPSYGVQYSAGDSSFGVPGKIGMQYPVGGSILGLPGKDGPIIDKSQFPQTDFGGSGILNHTPYAATFEQPLNSQFSSNILPQDNNAPGVNMSDTVVRIPVDAQGVGSAGSKQTTSPPSSARAVGQLLPKSNTEQYDPLFDSIEPSTNPLNRNDHSQRHIPTSDSNMMVRLSGACEPLDVEDNYKRTEFGHIPSATSLDYDGYDETADAEVGFVEDESYSYDEGVLNMVTGEIENDQVKSAGKSNKYKDSRSTRHFKSAVADFVKDLLKPSWRQGNMSKEAFKTIVRKTVDKVSGAMKSHQIPKSEAKINHYMESSQRKLTKLVMGYVDKYVKV